MDSLGREMKRYTAWFQNDEASQTIIVECDGISENHAQARAWIKFMATQAFKEDKDNWELEAVEFDESVSMED